jgi:hypothetical protein
MLTAYASSEYGEICMNVNTVRPAYSEITRDLNKFPFQAGFHLTQVLTFRYKI